MPPPASMAVPRPRATCSAISGSVRPPCTRWCSRLSASAWSAASRGWRAASRCSSPPKTCPSYAIPNPSNPLCRGTSRLPPVLCRGPMPSIPQDPSPDSSLALLREGYAFISNRCHRFGSDLFQTRLMLTRAVCIQGAEAAAQFYWPDRFTRRFAMPRFSLSLIQDFGSVMVMDGEAHRRRKAMFLSLMTPGALQHLSDLTAQHWRAWVHRWQSHDRIVLFHAAHAPLTAAVCAWAGLTLTDDEVVQRAREFEAMVEGTGSVGPRNWRGHLLRARTERWMRNVVRRIRAGELHVPTGSAAAVVASHRDLRGDLLDVKVAAVELINVLRPTVANARYAVFVAMALHDHPAWRERLARAMASLRRS